MEGYPADHDADSSTQADSLEPKHIAPRRRNFITKMSRAGSDLSGIPATFSDPVLLNPATHPPHEHNLSLEVRMNRILAAQGEGLEATQESSSAHEVLRIKGYTPDEIASGDVYSEDRDLVDRLQDE